MPDGCRPMCNLAAWGTGTRSGSSSASARRSASPRPARCAARSSALVVAAAAAVAIGFAVRPVGRGGRRRGRRDLRRARLGAARRRHAAARRHARRHRAAARARVARRRRARVRSGARLPRGARGAGARRTPALAARRSATPGCARLPGTDASQAKPKPVVLVIVDGLTPSMFEAADTPALRFLAEHGEYRRAVVDVPVADARLPQLDRDRRASRRATTSRTSSGGIAASSGSSSTARRSARSAPPGSRARCATRSST